MAMSTVRRGANKGFLIGTPTGSRGQLLTAGAVNVKGTYVSLLSSTPYDLDGFDLRWTNGPNSRYPIDIAIGASGSQRIIVPDFLPCGNNGYARIPRRIPSGSNVWARVASSTASDTVQLTIHTFASNARGTQGFNRCKHIGWDAANTRGTALSDSGASLNTKGAWVTGGTLDVPAKAVIVFATSNQTSPTTQTSGVIQCDCDAIASASTPSDSDILIPDWCANATAGPNVQGGLCEPVEVNLPGDSSLVFKFRHQTNTSAASPSARFIRFSAMVFW
jgi:hypothetical protein